jgi:flagellar biosynthesis/type III secretory pathway M-ring protein FliF/YscJ
VVTSVISNRIFNTNFKQNKRENKTMATLETVVWVLSGVVPFFIILFGVIWKMLRDETKEHSEAIKKKADKDRLIESETRWSDDLSRISDDNKELISRIESRHERDLTQMEDRLSSQIRNSEANILSQLTLMMQYSKHKD